MSASRPDRFLRRHDMLSMVGVPQSTVYLMMQRGEFPRSYQISRRLVGWKKSRDRRLDGEPSRLSAPATATESLVRERWDSCSLQRCKASRSCMRRHRRVQGLERQGCGNGSLCENA